MKSIVFHVDVNSAFLSWKAVYRLRYLGETKDLREEICAVGGDSSQRHGLLLWSVKRIREGCRMAFGLGEQYERTSRPPGRTAESVWEQWREQRIDIACECWFTSQGKTMPRLIKFMDAEGQLRTVRNIKVNYMEDRNYSGIHSVEYDCDVEYGGRREKIKLFFYTAKCRWAMRFVRDGG